MSTEDEMRQIRLQLAQKGQDIITQWQTSEEKYKQDKQEENRQKASDRRTAFLLKRKNKNTVKTLGQRMRENAAKRREAQLAASAPQNNSEGESK